MVMGSKFCALGPGLAMAAFLSVSCFGPEPKGPDSFMDKSLSVELSFDLGLMEGGQVVFGKGDSVQRTGETMILLSDSSRSCFFWVDWDNPGDCRADDTWKFSSNGGFSMNAGAKSCAPDEPKTATGAWSFNADETELTVVLDGDTAAFAVESKSEKQLCLSEVEPDSSGCGPNVYVKTLYDFAAP